MHVQHKDETVLGAATQMLQAMSLKHFIVVMLSLALKVFLCWVWSTWLRGTAVSRLMADPLMFGIVSIALFVNGILASQFSERRRVAVYKALGHISHAPRSQHTPFVGPRTVEGNDTVVKQTYPFLPLPTCNACLDTDSREHIVNAFRIQCGTDGIPDLRHAVEMTCHPYNVCVTAHQYVLLAFYGTFAPAYFTEEYGLLAIVPVIVTTYVLCVPYVHARICADPRLGIADVPMFGLDAVKWMWEFTLLMSGVKWAMRKFRTWNTHHNTQ